MRPDTERRECRFDDWQENRSYLITPAVDQLGVFMKTLKDYPPRAKSFDANIDNAMNSLLSGSGN